ncbi:glycerol transporter [Quaeritorhiza haematococci]|nr:glycerol transporter [Quaeritorhiza haematococci]
MLRMVSYAMDYYWHCRNDPSKGAGGSSSSARKGKNVVYDNDEKTRIPQLPKDYGYIYYLVYTLYIPLYLAGPIIGYDDFVGQILRPAPSDTPSPKSPSSSSQSEHLQPPTLRSTIVYAVRWIFCVLVMEAMLHLFYVVSISKERAWDGFTPFQISMIGYFNLKLIWLKLLIVWRFFRLWAMADGISTVENMHRCMSNNYSAMGFWRSWHRSYNRWLIR